MLLDWTCTPTTLYLGEWIKLEDIFSGLYIGACNLHFMECEQRRKGQPQPLCRKWGTGFLFFALLNLLVRHHHSPLTTNHQAGWQHGGPATVPVHLLSAHPPSRALRVWSGVASALHLQHGLAVQLRQPGHGRLHDRAGTTTPTSSLPPSLSSLTGSTATYPPPYQDTPCTYNPTSSAVTMP